MITLEDLALIRRLHVGEGLPKAQIARQLGASRNTVAKAIASTDPPAYSRLPVVSSFAPFEERVRALLDVTWSMPAKVLAERVGWTGSPSWFRENVAAIRPDYAPTDPADRIVYHAGDQAQCDLWFPEPRIPVGDGTRVVLPVLVMVASFSKFITATMIPSRTTADLLAGTWLLLASQLGAVPRRLIWDNEAGIGRRNHLAVGVGEFTGHLATRIHQLTASPRLCTNPKPNPRRSPPQPGRPRRAARRDATPRDAPATRRPAPSEPEPKRDQPQAQP